VNTNTVQASDLLVDGTQAATSVNVLDADTVEFFLPTLGAGTHSAAIAAGAMLDTLGTGLDAFTKSFAIVSTAQYTMKQNPRLQPGNAPLAGYAGGDLDRVDILLQTIPGGTGTQDSFSVEYRAVGATAWQTVPLNAAINTGVEGRVVRSASITGLNWNSDYEYRVRHQQADVIVGQYASTFHTRLAAGDATPFTFVAYGDSASGSATGFRQVQSRINQVDPSFAVLLGDNVYTVGSHPELDSRFSPTVNPEAAAWMAGSIDYLGLGNHDVGTEAGLPSEQSYSVPIPVAGVTAPAAPPATERPEHSFSWDYGDVHFVTFDTNSLLDTTRLDGLLNWVVTDLSASTARWKIVYGHHPLAGVPDKTENPAQNYYQQVVNRLQAAGVDLFMTGHSHTYSWTYPLTGQINGVATYANHGADDLFHAGEGLPQLVSGVGGVGIRSGDYGQFPFVAEGFTSTTPIPARLGFAQISVTQGQLTVRYIAADNGAVIDSFVIAKDPALQTVTFQQGVNGYTGTVDTFLHQNTPGTSNAAAASLKVDGDDPVGTGLDAQALLRFDNLFGSGAGQIPPNATLRTAMLQLQVTNGSINNLNLHRMIGTWSATDTWNTLVAGVQTDGIEAVAAPDTSSGQSQIGKLSFNVLASLQAWRASPTSNFGWAIVPTGADGVDFNSSEGTTKPKLLVTYVVDTGPNGPPVATNDTATTNGNTAVTISVLSNDTDPNGDPLSVQSVTTPAHGSVALTAGSTVTYTPVVGYFGPDTFGYTISDGRGGTATATVSVTVVQTVVFQSAVGGSGYAGTVDTFLQQNLPSVDNSAAVSLNVDSDDPFGTGLDVQTLLRFEDLFGSGAGQIPLTAALQSATLQLQVTNPGNSMNLHRMLSNWSATDTWNSLSGGVQPDGVEAVAAADVSTGAAAVSVAFSINVLPSLLAWQAAPASNRGWVLLPTGSDGVDFDSAEGTTKPKLSVNYIPATTSKFFVVDNGVDDTFQYTSTGSLFLNHNLAATNLDPKGVATSLDGSTVWVLDGKKIVFVYNATGTLLGSWTASGLKTPTGITTTGSDLWIVDKGADRAYRFSGATSRRSGSVAATSSFALGTGNTTPEGIATDGSKHWVVNSASPDKVFVYSMAGVLQGSWTIDSRNSSPTGLTIDPSGASQSIWIVDNSKDRVYEYTNALSRLSGSQTAATSFVLAAGNTSPQDIADPRGWLSLYSARPGLTLTRSVSAERQRQASLTLRVSVVALLERLRESSRLSNSGSDSALAKLLASEPTTGWFLPREIDPPTAGDNAATSPIGSDPNPPRRADPPRRIDRLFAVTGLFDALDRLS